ncbi:hypothetical protein GGI43DRAFT_302940 [Trichoderma evansii]
MARQEFKLCTIKFRTESGLFEGFASPTRKYWQSEPEPKYWPRNDAVQLTVSFLDGTDDAARILGAMNAWGDVANVRFTQVDNKIGTVRIARRRDDGHWSYLGTDIVSVPMTDPTMNLDSFTVDTPDDELRRVVIHETGHTLGFPHEHQPSATVKRIVPDVALTWFEKNYAWPKSQVFRDVLTAQDNSALVETADPDLESIMCTWLPRWIMVDETPVIGGTNISVRDGQFAGSVYPKSSFDDFQNFVLQKVTGLRNIDDTFDFAIADWIGPESRDLVAIKRSNTITESTEVYILSGASNFKKLILHKGTALHTTDKTFSFAMTFWNDGDGVRRPDLVAIKKCNTGTNSTEVHILSGESQFQDFILQKGTPLPNTDETFDFTMLQRHVNKRKPNLVAVEKAPSNTGLVKVCILSGASDFQHTILKVEIRPNITVSNFKFVATYWTSRGQGSQSPDLVAIEKLNGDSEDTKVIIFTGTSNYQGRIPDKTIGLGNRFGAFTWAMAPGNGDRRPDLVAIRRSSTRTQANNVEVHILAGGMRSNSLSNFELSLWLTSTNLIKAMRPAPPLLGST